MWGSWIVDVDGVLLFVRQTEIDHASAKGLQILGRERRLLPPNFPKDFTPLEVDQTMALRWAIVVLLGKRVSVSRYLTGRRRDGVVASNVAGSSRLSSMWGFLRQ